jgi:hypothetical protein
MARLSTAIGPAPWRNSPLALAFLSRAAVINAATACAVVGSDVLPEVQPAAVCRSARFLLCGGQSMLHPRPLMREPTDVAERTLRR